MNNTLETRSGREIKGLLEHSWVNNKIVDYQDVDYAQTKLTSNMSQNDNIILVSDTSEFPEVGRLMIDSEIIYYTGKTPTSFTGCQRGRRETKITSHLKDTTVHNGYKVLIEGFTANVPIISKDNKKLEYVVGLSLREVI